MSDQASPSLVSRIVHNDAFRKSIAGVIAGTLVAVISETLWPSSESWSSLVGDALVALLDLSWPRFKRRVKEIVEHVADLVTPHPPLTLRTLNNEVITGLVVLDRGAALLFIGIREPAPAIVTPPPVRDPRHFDDDGIPPWGRDVRVDPYRR